MRRICAVGAAVVLLFVLLLPVTVPTGGSAQIQPIAPMTVRPLQLSKYFLIGNLARSMAIVTTEGKRREAVFQGEIAFRATQGEKGQLQLNLERLNLVSEGMVSMIGDTGVIGLNLLQDEDQEYDVAYNTRTGEIFSEFESKLHYPLIDEKLGFREMRSEECAYFESYTERMAGKLVGRLPEKLEVSGEGKVELVAEIQLYLTDQVLGVVEEMIISVAFRLEWVVIFQFEPAEILRVQPVFIGSGPSDSTATGSSFNTMIARADEIWDRCGTVRCIQIVANPPIYVNNNDYRVLNSTSEAANLRAEVNITDAVEIFIVERWDPYYDGGGACWSSGTASAKIVTCDQQLSVPCPPPSPPCTGVAYCGLVNEYHLGHELGHAINLAHPGSSSSLSPSTSTSIMEPSGFCRDNPAVQSARNCRNAANPLLYWGLGVCKGSPDISD